MLGCGYYAFMAASKPQQNLLLGATLRKEQMDHPQVQELVQKYRRSVKRFTLLCILLHIPLLILTQWYISVFITLYLLWCFFLYAGAYYLYHKYFLALFALKKEKGWFIEDSARLVTIDTKLSQIGDRMPLSAWWFLPAFFLCLVPLLIPGGFQRMSGTVSLKIYFGISMGLNLVFLLLYYVTAFKRTVVYSMNSRINLSCNRIAKRLWSLCWIGTSWINSLSILFLQWYWNPEEGHTLLAFTVYFCLQTAAILLLFYILYAIHGRTQELLAADTEPVIVDEDVYWTRGYYYNPERKSLLAPSKPGMTSNLSFNMAHPAAKLLCFVFWGGIAALLLWMILMFIRMDFTPFEMDFRDSQVYITAGSYDLDFPVADIQELSLENDLPTKSYSKNNGADTSQYLLGKFRLPGYGQARLYYYIGYSPVIRIQLPEYTVYFNTKNSEKTKELYRQLNQAIY